MEKSYVYLWFVALAGVCWGTYVPIITAGGKALKSSYASFLCVGVAYFLIAVLIPIVVLWSRGAEPKQPAWGNSTRIALATTAGVAGALGALCVILATFEFNGPKELVAPLIFATAPVINTVVSLFWQPKPGAVWNFDLPETLPHWTFFVGIVLAGVGAGLVLYSKEAGEHKPADPKAATQAQVARPPAAVAPE